MPGAIGWAPLLEQDQAQSDEHQQNSEGAF